MKRLLIGLPLALLALVVLTVLAIALVPRSWLAERLEGVLLKNTGYTVGIGELELDLLSLHPTVRLRDVDVDGNEVPGLVEGADLTATVALLPLFKGELLIERVALADANVLARRDADGRSTWSGVPIERAEPDEADSGPIEIPAIESLSIENVTVRLDDRITAHEATLRPSAEGSTTDGAVPLTARIEGDIDGAATELRLALPSLAAGQTLDAGVELDLDASLGDVAATLDGTVGNPMTLRDLTLDATLEAGELGAIETILGRELPDLEPIDFEASVRTEGDTLILEPFTLSADGLDASGEARLERGSDPPEIEAMLSVATVDVDALLETFGVGSMSEEMAEEVVEDVVEDMAEEAAVVAEDTDVAPDAPPLTVDTLFGTVHGTIVVEVAEILGETSPLDAMTARLELGADAATLAIGGDVGGSDADIDLAITPRDTAGIEIAFDAALGSTAASATGHVGELAALREIALDVAIDADSLAAVEAALGRELPDLEPITLGARVRSEGTEIVLERFALSATGIVAEGAGRIDPEAVPPVVQASLEVPTVDVDALSAMFSIDAEDMEELADEADPAVPDMPAELVPTFVVSRLFDTVRADVAIDIDEIVSTTLPLDSLAARLRVDAASATLTVQGDVAGNAADLSLALSPLEERADTGLALDLDATLDGVTADVAGSVGDLNALREVEIDATLEADSLDVVEALLGSELPDLEPIAFGAQVLSEGSELIVRRFELSAVGLDAEGDLRVDPDTAPPTLYANVIASRLDVDALNEAIGMEEAVEEAVVDADGEAADAPSEAALLSDAPLPFDRLFDTVQGAVQLRIDDIAGESLPLEGVDVRVELDPSRATLALDELRVARGTVGGDITLEPREATAATPDGAVPVAATVELELAGIDVTRVLREVDAPEEAAEAGGRLGARIKLWSEGASVAALAGGLDGGALALMSGGTVNALFVELAGIDLFQSLGDVLVPGEEEVPIRCAYVDLQSENGLLRLDRFVIDTEDTVFLAEGTVNLGTEALALTLEPHPKDPSLLAASTAVELGGTFTAPEIGVDGSLAARAAAVVLLSQVAAPALLLLPLLEIGGGEDSPFCSGLDGALD